MSLSAITREAVLEAIQEFDRRGREGFLETYGFQSGRYYLKLRGRLYESKAIVGVSHAYALPPEGPLPPARFSGGRGKGQAATILERLGFSVVDVLDPEPLRAGGLYRLQVPGTAPAYRYVVEEVKGDTITIRRGWYDKVYPGDRESSDDVWALSEESQTVGRWDVEVVEVIGQAPKPGDRREFDPSWHGDGDSSPVTGSQTPDSSERASPSWMLAPGDTVLRRDLHDRFGGKRRGGISPSRVTSNVFVFTDPAVGEQHGYLDFWDGEVLHYYGEGQTGNQRMTGGNRAILEHQDAGRSLRAFEGVRGEVKYLGEFRLDNDEPYYMSSAHQTGGGRARRVIVFKLHPLNYAAREIPSARGVGLSTPYRPANENTTSKAPDPFTVDPNKVDRATQAHRRLQNLLEEYASSLGAQTRSPGALDPDFDLAWRLDGRIVVAEVKSLTPSSETRQLRLGLGQVLHYRHLLEAGGEEVEAVLFVEREPSDPIWMALCADLGVRLTWPERIEDEGL